MRKKHKPRLYVKSVEVLHKDDPIALERIMRFLLLAFELADKKGQANNNQQDFS